MAGLLLGPLTLTVLTVPAARADDRVAASAPSTTEPLRPEADERDLPRTALEADEREHDSTPQAPYVVWSGLAAAAMVGGGGLWLRRRQQREADTSPPGR